MNNKIRIARTEDLSAITQGQGSLVYGQPFYDGAKKLLYIGATPEYSTTTKTISDISWTGSVYISQQTKLQQYLKSQDDTVNDVYKDIYILTYKGWTQTLLTLGYHTWQDQYGKYYYTPTILLSSDNNIAIRPSDYTDQGNIDYIGVKFTTGNLKDNPSAFVDKAQIIIELKNSVNFTSPPDYRDITLFRPSDSINAYNVIGKIKNTPITDIFNLDNNGLIKEVKKANHATTATIGQYASLDTSKGTIEQRLTNLGFVANGTLTFSAGISIDSTTTNTIVRKGNSTLFDIDVDFRSYPYLTANSIVIGTINSDFWPVTNYQGYGMAYSSDLNILTTFGIIVSISSTTGEVSISLAFPGSFNTRRIIFKVGYQNT